MHGVEKYRYLTKDLKELKYIIFGLESTVYTNYQRCGLLYFGLPVSNCFLGHIQYSTVYTCSEYTRTRISGPDTV